jgi:hypothetical protein
MAQPIPVTDYRDLSRLHTGRKQVRRCANSELRPVYALDTETYNGDIFLIADSDGEYLDIDLTADSILHFLFDRKYQGAWNFFWNLRYDASVILKLLGKNLMAYAQTRRLNFTHGEFKLQYIPGKCLRIMKGHKSVLFFDIAQFFSSGALVKAYQENIGPVDSGYHEFKSLRDQFSRRFYRRHTSAIRNYCIQDCRMTKQLAEKWISLFYKAANFYPARWYSSGYIAEKFLINNGVCFPTFDSVPYAIQEMAYRSSVGGRFEILKRGFIGHANLYDINSAYPHKVAYLPDLNDGRWIGRKAIHPDAKLGFFAIKANIPDTKRVPPFPFKANSVVIFPSGRFKTYVTLDELRACEDDSYYRILNSWQFVSNDPDSHPYKEFIEELYRKRRELKDSNDPLQLPIKTIMNSIYGKTGQKVNRVIGNLFSPVIFASITGSTRAQMYRFVIDKDLEDDVVSFATDSICTTKDLDLKSSRLGDFSLDRRGDDVYYLQNGIYRFNGKWKLRGVGSTGGKTVEHIETIEKAGRLYLVLTPTRSASLRECIIQNRIQDIGKIRPIRRLVNLNADRKRLWLDRLKSLDDGVCNDSMPISLNYFTKEEI